MTTELIILIVVVAIHLVVFAFVLWILFGRRFIHGYLAIKRFMTKTKWIILIVVGVLIVGFLGFWFIYRPWAIKKSCYKKYEWQKRIKRFNDLYYRCLKEKGL